MSLVCSARFLVLLTTLISPLMKKDHALVSYNGISWPALFVKIRSISSSVLAPLLRGGNSEPQVRARRGLQLAYAGGYQRVGEGSGEVGNYMWRETASVGSVENHRDDTPLGPHRPLHVVVPFHS